MTLRRKLLLTFGLVLLLVALQAVVAVTVATQVVDGSALLVEPALSRVDLLAHAEADVLRLRTLEYSLVWSTNDTARDEAAKEIGQLRVDIQQRLEAYHQLVLGTNRGPMVERVLSLFDDFLASERVIEAQARFGDQGEAVWAYLRTQSEFQTLDDQMHGLRHSEYAATEALRDQMVQAAIWARWPLAAGVLLVGVAEAALGWYISRSISRSLAVLQQGARRIAQERLDEPIPPPAEPELMTLADTLNAVMKELAANRDERARLEQERLRLLRDQLSQVVKAQEQERVRVARELHDQAGQAITALKFGLARVQKLTTSPEAAAELDRLVALAAETGHQVASLARDLRPAVLDDLGLIPALRTYTHEFTDRIGVPVALDVAGSIPRISTDAETAIFRVVQEALTNVAKHAHARHVWLQVSLQGGELRVVVRDDGRGFDPRAKVDVGRSSGLGLAGIEERVRLLDGTFELTSEVGKGTSILVSIPVPRNGHVTSLTREVVKR